MDNALKIKVKETARDRHARVTETEIGKKTVSTPNFCAQLQDSSELDLLMRLKMNYPSDRLTTSIVRFTDVQQVLWRLHPKTPRDVFMQVRQDKYSLFFEKQLLLIDPSLEYLYYLSRMNGFLSNRYTPKIIIDYINEIEKIKQETEYLLGKRKTYRSFESKREKQHRQFWRKLADEKNRESNQQRFELINAFIKCNLTYKTDAMIPPVPMIDDLKTLEIAKKMNDDTKELARGKKHCATYLLFKSNVLEDWSLLDKALRYIAENSRDSLIVIKFKNLDLTKKDLQTERENYQRFMSDLEFFSKTFKNRANLVLENNCQTFVSALAGFDIVSSSLTNYDFEHSYGKYAPYGKWLHPILLIHRPWKKMIEIYEKLGRLPHNCGFCRSVNVKSLDQLKKDEWYTIRRGHVASFMNEWFTYIKKAIDTDKNIELVVDRLANSKIQILKDLLPAN
jgi:hypothetical protein